MCDNCQTSLKKSTDLDNPHSEREEVESVLFIYMPCRLVDALLNGVKPCSSKM